MLCDIIAKVHGVVGSLEKVPKHFLGDQGKLLSETDLLVESKTTNGRQFGGMGLEELFRQNIKPMEEKSGTFKEMHGIQRDYSPVDLCVLMMCAWKSELCVCVCVCTCGYVRSK